jgi:microcystin-dependent protein
MAFLLSPIGNEAQIDGNGDPLSGGLIETYVAGTSTLAPTFTDITGAVPQTNPIVLSTLGLPPQPIWLNSASTYKFIIKTSTGIVQRTVDNISGISTAIPTATDQWVVFPGTPTFINTTTFSLVGDQTNTFTPNRRTRTINTGGTVYSSIATSVFGGGITTITLVNDAPGILDAGLSQVSYGILSSVNSSIPSTIAQSSFVTFTGMPVFTTTGTIPNYVLTPSPAIASYVNGMRFRVRFHANATSSPPYTLNISGLGPKTLAGMSTSGPANRFSPTILTDYSYDIEYVASIDRLIVLNPISADMLVGELFWYMLNATPLYALLCNGAAVSRATYGRLFQVVGTFYGAGDGTTTFNVPNVGAEQTLLQAIPGSNEGVFYAGSTIAHAHTIRTTAIANVGSTRLVVDAAGVTNSSTESAGGSANIAAGTRARLCIRF